MLAFLLKGASFTKALEAFEIFEVQVGKALLAFCVAPLVLAAAFAAHDFGATRELKRRIERNATLSSAPSKAATHLARLSSKLRTTMGRSFTATSPSSTSEEPTV